MLVTLITFFTIVAYIAMMVLGATIHSFVVGHCTREYRLCWYLFLATAGMAVAGVVALCLIICKYGCPAG